MKMIKILLATMSILLPLSSANAVSAFATDAELDVSTTGVTIILSVANAISGLSVGSCSSGTSYQYIKFPAGATVMEDRVIHLVTNARSRGKQLKVDIIDCGATWAIAQAVWVY
ncbi:MAG: hypothetical protein OEZ39_19790 [Gammaproteobacteria bacterium]|nr:hypothetical protein [Gammaproteobacteria bacterium]MDH5654110.1 hypothetical protein [Gammaproteobacteria bacterium]